MRVAFTIAAVVVVGGCAAIAGISDREGTFCTREPHDLCEDYDNEETRHVWNGPNLDGSPVTTSIVPSERSAPNAFSLRFPASTDQDAAIDGLIGEVYRDRGPDGLSIAFDVRIDEVDLPNIPLSDPDAGDGGATGPDPPAGAGTLAFAIVQWNRGGVAVGLRHDGAYAFVGTRKDEAPTPQFDRAIPLVSMNELIGKWNRVEVRIFLTGKPAVEVRYGERPGKNPELDPSVTELQVSTEIIFGGVIIGPSGKNTITIDNLIADFPRRQ